MTFSTRLAKPSAGALFSTVSALAGIAGLKPVIAVKDVAGHQTDNGQREDALGCLA